MASEPQQEAARSIAASVLSMHQAGLDVVATTVQQTFQNHGSDMVEDMLQGLTADLNVFQKAIDTMGRLDETSPAFQILQGLMWRNDGQSSITAMVSRTMTPMLMRLSAAANHTSEPLPASSPASDELLFSQHQSLDADEPFPETQLREENLMRLDEQSRSSDSDLDLSEINSILTDEIFPGRKQPSKDAPPVDDTRPREASILSEVSSMEVDAIITQLLQPSSDTPRSASPWQGTRASKRVPPLESDSLSSDEAVLSDDASPQIAEPPRVTGLSKEAAMRIFDVPVDSPSPMPIFGPPDLDEPSDDVFMQEDELEPGLDDSTPDPSELAATGWESLRLDGTDGERPLLPGQEPYSEAQLKAISCLNFNLKSARGRIPPKVLNSIAKIIYFRNLDITAQDSAILLSNVSPGRRKTLKKMLKIMKAELQRQVWRNKWFLGWVGQQVPKTAGCRDSAVRLWGGQRFWESRVNFNIVGRLFAPLQPVNIAVAWADALWRRHLTVSVAEAACAVFLNIDLNEPSFADRKASEKVFEHIRRAPDRRFGGRPGLDRVPMGEEVL